MPKKVTTNVERSNTHQEIKGFPGRCIDLSFANKYRMSGITQKYIPYRYYQDDYRNVLFMSYLSFVCLSGNDFMVWFFSESHHEIDG